MSEFKSFLISFCIIVAIMGLILSPAIFNSMTEAGINPFDYARITELDYKAVVVDEPGSDGKIVVTERITFDIHAAFESNPFRELWRDLCEDWIDGVHVKYQVNYVKQILDDGTEIEYDNSYKLYYYDDDYERWNTRYGPEKWYHSKGPYNPDTDDYECVFLYVDEIYREKMVFEIQYEMYNAVLKYNDCSDLYISLYSENTINYLESVNAEILIPNKDMPSAGNYFITTYGTDANSFPVTESATKNPGYYTFSFSLDEDDLQFSPYNEYIEFDLVAHGKDKHIFAEYASRNYYTSDDVLDEIIEEQEAYASEPEQYATKKYIVLIIMLMLSVLVLFYSFACKIRMRNKHMFFEPQVDYQWFRDIPSNLDPHFAATLVFAKDKKLKDVPSIYSSILLSLARKKYVKLSEDMNKKVFIYVNEEAAQFAKPVIKSSYMFAQYTPLTVEETYPEFEKLTVCEKIYFDLILRHCSNSVISMEEFEHRVATDYDNTSMFVTRMDNSVTNIGVSEGYFQKADYMEAKKSLKRSSKALYGIGFVFLLLVSFISYRTRMDFAYGGYFIFGISCIVGGWYMKKQSYNHILLTQYGENEYQKWRGLYNFLNSNTLMNERTLVELPLWEKYLVYATAFGISDKVVQAIRLRCPLQTESDIINHNFCSSGRIRGFGNGFSRSVYSGSGRSLSGGSGGSFGYGGGGRGGGGGGGGH